MAYYKTRIRVSMNVADGLCLLLWRLDDWMNFIIHNVHLYGISPMCVLKCILWFLDSLKCLCRRDESLNVFVHNVHLYGSSHVCVLKKCFLRLDDWLNFIIHNEQLYGFSPVCVLKCTLSLDESLNAFMHNMQLWDVTLLWLFTCDWRFDDEVNCPMHILHLYGFSPICVLLWSRRWCCPVKCLLGNKHRIDFPRQRICIFLSSLVDLHCMLSVDTICGILPPGLVGSSFFRELAKSSFSMPSWGLSLVCEFCFCLYPLLDVLSSILFFSIVKDRWVFLKFVVFLWHISLGPGWQ